MLCSCRFQKMAWTGQPCTRM